MSSGIEYLFGTTITPMFKLSVVLVVSIIATVSVVSGLKRGIKFLSETNIWLCLILLSFILFAGPTIVILSSLFSGTLDISSVIPLSFWVDPSIENLVNLMDFFYWGWWIMGTVCRNVYGENIQRKNNREYVLGTVIFPCYRIYLVDSFWCNRFIFNPVAQVDWLKQSMKIFHRQFLEPMSYLMLIGYMAYCFFHNSLNCIVVCYFIRLSHSHYLYSSLL